MAINYPAGQYQSAYAQIYNPIFTKKFQATQRLRSMVTETNMEGAAALNFPYIAQVIMTPATSFGGVIPSVNVTVTQITVNPNPFQLKTYVADFEQAAMNAQAVGPQAELHAMSSGRRADQYIIDALSAGTTNTIADGAVSLTPQKLLDAQRILGLNEVPEDDRYFIGHVNDFYQLKQNTQFISILYSNEKFAANANGPNGYIGDFAGFHLFELGDRAEGGLPYNSTTKIRTCFAFQKSAMHLGYNVPVKTNIVEIPQDFYMAVSTIMSGGAVVGDPLGTVAVNCFEGDIS